jgi:two-component sensor histidine kinase
VAGQTPNEIATGLKPRATRRPGREAQVLKLQGAARLRRGATVRERLQLMSLCLILPAIIAMALLLDAQYQASRSQFEDQLLANARLLGVGVDRELEHGRTLLGGLALAPSLQAGNLETFDRLARAATRGRPGWIVLKDDRQHQLVNTLVPPGGELPAGGASAEAWAAARQGRTYVSGLGYGTVAKRPVITIDRPVLLKGRLYVLSYVQEPAAFQSLLTPRLLPASWIAVIIDQHGRVVARSEAPAKSLGRLATPDLRAAVKRSQEGVMTSHSLEGTPTLLSYTRSPATGWAFVVAVPRRELQWAAARSVGAAFVGFGVLLIAGLASARWFARPISRDIGDLADQARRLAGAQPQVELGGDLPETAAVREALASAAEGLALRASEQSAANLRQQTLINELNHRVKNSLATVQSLARHSFASPEERRALHAFEDRVVALSQAHNLLTQNAWTGADLGPLVAQTLAPYADRTTFGGPAISLDPQAALSLSLVLHELATNAAKYGAYSGRGAVDVTWRLRPEAGRIELTWIERDGPPAATPTHEGFGSRLIRQSIERELRGAMSVDHRTEGFRWTFDLPLSDRMRARPDPEPHAPEPARAG